MADHEAGVPKEAAANGAAAAAAAAASPPPAPPPPSRAARVQAFVVKHYLPLAFGVAVVWAMAWPAPGVAVGGVTILSDPPVHLIQEINMITVFFISGLVLNTRDLRTAARHKLGVVWGFVAILGLTPLLGFAFREVPLNPSEYATGLVVLSAVPTTLGIGIALVRSCRGNEGLALLLTVGTNLLGVGVIPGWLSVLLDSGEDDSLGGSFDALDLFIKLTITIAAPSFVGKALREAWPAAARFATRYRTALSIISTTSLAMIVWQSLSGAQDEITSTPFEQTLYAILLAIGQHLLYLVLNFGLLVYALRMPAAEAVATGVMASQKSAPVAVTVISYLSGDLSTQGLLAVPCICSQICQIFIGSLLAPHLASWVKKAEAAARAEAEAAAKAKAGLIENGGGMNESSLQ